MPPAKKSEPLNWDSRLEVQTGPVQKQDHLARAAAVHHFHFCQHPSHPSAAIRAATPLARVCPSICPSQVSVDSLLSFWNLNLDLQPTKHPFPPLNLSLFFFSFSHHSFPRLSIRVLPVASTINPLLSFLCQHSSSTPNCNTLLEIPFLVDLDLFSAWSEARLDKPNLGWLACSSRCP